MTSYSIHSEHRTIGGALFNLSLSYWKGQGYHAIVTPGYEERGSRILRPFSQENVCLQKTERGHRFNRKAAEKLIPQAQEAYRDLILKIVRKEAGDRSLNIGMTALNAMGVWDTVREQVPLGMSELIEKLDKVENLEPHQAAFAKAEILLKLALDGLLPVPVYDDLPLPAAFRYGGILAFVEIYDDAKDHLLEWGKTCGDAKAQEMIQQWESVVGSTPEKAAIKAQMEKLLLQLLPMVKVQNAGL